MRGFARQGCFIVAIGVAHEVFPSTRQAFKSTSTNREKAKRALTCCTLTIFSSKYSSVFSVVMTSPSALIKSSVIALHSGPW